MSRHTPGSWKVVKSLHGTIDGWPIAFVGDGLKVVSGPMHSDLIGAAEDDARLIAAAPDLLEALKLVDDLLNKGVLVRDITRDAEPNWAMEILALVQDLNKIKLAIAKAEET